MSVMAKGSFEVTLVPQGDTDELAGVKLGRLSLEKTFSGDLVGTAKGTMLSARTQLSGSAGYVAIERITGSLHGKTGSFVFPHSGSMNRGVPSLSIGVVPDSGTGDLSGIAGTFSLSIVDGRHLYEFEYSLPD